MPTRRTFLRLLSFGLLAATLPPVARAADRFAGVPAAVQAFVDRGEIAGAVMLVADRERVLHLSAVGVSDLATGRPQQTDDLFWIASMTKPVNAVAVALLVDDGKLAFDDPVEKYVPEFRDRWVVAETAPDRRVLLPAARPITLRDLLTHTSGLGEYGATSPHWTLAEFARVLAREPLRFQPGTRWGYSTAGTDLLSRVVEVAAGEPFAAFVQRRLFDPLGMKDTVWWVPESADVRRARCYRRDASTGRLVDAPIHYLYGGAESDRARPAMGGAGLFSTATDIARFYQLMANGGSLAGQRLLRAETVAELTRVQTGELKTRPGMPWGLGFCVIADPAQMAANRHFSPGTFGHGGAFGTQSWADPATGLVYVFLIQRDKIPDNPDNSPMRQAYQQAVAEALAR